MKLIRIVHSPTGTTLAEGPVGWGITPFEGNIYIQAKHLRVDGFKRNLVPGVCPYKGIYVWLDLQLPDQPIVKNLGWKYWLPNPLLPFIWFRVAVPRHHPELEIIESEAA